VDARDVGDTVTKAGFKENAFTFYQRNAAKTAKKWIGHGHELNLTEVEKELGDILWYISEIATTLDLRLDQVAAKNMDKLVARYPEGFSEERSRNRGADR